MIKSKKNKNIKLKTRKNKLKTRKNKLKTRRKIGGSYFETQRLGTVPEQQYTRPNPDPRPYYWQQESNPRFSHLGNYYDSRPSATMNGIFPTSTYTGQMYPEEHYELSEQAQKSRAAMARAQAEARRSEQSPEEFEYAQILEQEKIYEKSRPEMQALQAELDQEKKQKEANERYKAFLAHQEQEEAYRKQQEEQNERIIKEYERLRSQPQLTEAEKEGLNKIDNMTNTIASFEAGKNKNTTKFKAAKKRAIPRVYAQLSRK